MCIGNTVKAGYIEPERDHKKVSYVGNPMYTIKVLFKSFSRRCYSCSFTQ